MPNLIDLTGKTFFNWTVIGRAENCGERVMWSVVCKCGKKMTYRADTLKSGRVKGCRRCTRIHGMTESSEYKIWRGMRKRCFDSNDRGYPNYGGRGITVCDRWANSFENFYEDMGARPSKNHSIDRIDNDGNYDPSNCRWATQKEQCRNYRNNRLVEYQGKSITVVELSEITGVDSALLYHRLDRGYSVKDAITKPINRQPLWNQ